MESLLRILQRGCSFRPLIFIILSVKEICVLSSMLGFAMTIIYRHIMLAMYTCSYDLLTR